MSIKVLPKQLGLLAAVVASCPGASEIEVMMSDEVGELRFTAKTERLGLRGNEASAAMFLTEENDVVLHGGAMLPVLQERTPLDFAIGGRIYLALISEPADDVIAISAGARVSYQFPFEKWPLTVASSVFYAPEIFTSGDNINLIDWDIARAELGLTDAITGLVGFRHFELDTVGSGDRELIDEVYGGLQVSF